MSILLCPCFRKTRVGASSVKTDDPSNDKDEGNNEPNSSRSRDSKSQNKGNHQAKPESRKQESKSKQKNQGKQWCKKINTLGGYASRVMVGDKKTTNLHSGRYVKSSSKKNTRLNYPKAHTWLRLQMMIICPAVLV